MDELQERKSTRQERGGNNKKQGTRERLGWQEIKAITIEQGKREKRKGRETRLRCDRVHKR